MTEQPTPVDRRRTTWPSAVELQKAADTLRDVAPQIEGRLAGLADPVADWLDETANALSWLAPYRDNEPGYGMWETALVVARKILGTTETEAERDAPAATEAQAEAYPTETSWIAEVQESDDQWMYLRADCDRAVVEQRIASMQKRFPQWKDGTPVNGRIIRKTTTYIVDTAPATTEETAR